MSEVSEVLNKIFKAVAENKEKGELSKAIQRIWDEELEVINAEVSRSLEQEGLVDPDAIEGVLVKNPNGRYAVMGKYEITSGMVVEVLDKLDGRFKWVETSVEWNDDYYLTKFPDMPMFGSVVRIRD